MNPAETSARSPLDKPLGELTEEDIAQLTREDCRRFLKQKGMRRPSWNKAQAIQQVISLKALLEDRPDSALRKSRSPPPPPPPPPAVTSPQVSDPSPYRRRDPNLIQIPTPIQQPALPACASRASPASDEVAVGNEDQPPSASLRGDAAQMTIFYGGAVNVYNDVPLRKVSQQARTIMQLASIPMDLNEPPPTESLDPNVAVHSCIDLVNVRPEVTRMPEGEDNLGGYTDCPTGRQASLLRYREKRKDRYKGKRIIGGLPSNMEMMFLSQKFKGQVPTEQSSQSNTSSAYPRPPCMPTTCSSVENPAQKFHTSFDLNDDGGGS